MSNEKPLLDPVAGKAGADLAAEIAGSSFHAQVLAH